MFHNDQETAFSLSMFRDFGRKLRKNSDNCCLTDSPNSDQTKYKSNQVGESMFVVQSLRRRRADILDVDESTLDVGELTVGETTVIR